MNQPWLIRGCPQITIMFLLTHIPNLTELLNNPGLTLIVRIGKVDPTFLLTPNSTRASRRGVFRGWRDWRHAELQVFKMERSPFMLHGSSWFWSSYFFYCVFFYVICLPSKFCLSSQEWWFRRWLHHLLHPESWRGRHPAFQASCETQHNLGGNCL